MIRRAAFGTPEQRPEKGQAADVDAADIADFVRAPGIVRRKNIHVLAEKQTWQRQRHQRTVQHAVTKAKGFIFGKRPGERPAVRPAQ